MVGKMFVVLIFVVFFCVFNGSFAQLSCKTPNNENAKCIPFKSCEAFTKIWPERTPKNIQFYRASHCGWNGTNALVCCGSVAEFKKIIPASRSQEDVSEETTEKSTVNSVITRETYTSLPTTTLNRYAKHRNIKLLPRKGICGVQVERDKIVGGEETGLDEYPWSALLIYRFGTTESYDCGGSLINERYVLTAAHCVAGKNLIKVRLGENDLRQSPDCIDQDCALPHQDFEIEEKVYYKTFSLRDISRRNDIALIRLSRNADFNEFVRPICLPLNGESSVPGEKLVVAGWGLTELNVTSDVKLQVQIPKWSNSGCRDVYNIGYGTNLSTAQICAGGETEKDSCVGDSGGPLMRTFPRRTDYYVEGIVSFGPKPCGRQATPGVYTKVSEYIEWILDNMKPF